MLISPSDVGDACSAVRRTIVDWNAHVAPIFQCQLELVHWQTSARSELGASVQEVLNDAIVDDADFALALFWNRVGTPTRTHASGSVEEVERLLSTNRRVLIYFCTAAPDSSHTDLQLEQVAQLRAHYETRGPVASFRNVDELARMVQSHITSLISELRSVRANELRDEALVDLASRVAAYVLVARNMKKAFDLFGEAALAEDAEANQVLGRAITAYNERYDALRIDRDKILQHISSLSEGPEWPNMARELLTALEDAHRRGAFRFNRISRDSVTLGSLRRKLSQRIEPHEQLEITTELKMAGLLALEAMRNCCEDTESAVRVLELQAQDFSWKVRGH